MASGGLLSGCGAGAAHSVASLGAEHRRSSWGTWAQLLCNMWDPPGPGIEPTSPALAGRFFTTEPPGKPLYVFNVCIEKGLKLYISQAVSSTCSEEKRDCIFSYSLLLSLLLNVLLKLEEKRRI